MPLADAFAQRFPELTFRPIEDRDRAFLCALYCAVRRDELRPVPWPEESKGAFLADQFRLQHEYYTQHYGDAEFLLILRGEDPIGRVYLQRQAQEIRIMEISLLDEERGKGLGGAIIRTVLDAAKRDGLHVTLHVEPFNPAKRLYERLGFTGGEQSGVYQHMNWKPA